MPASEDLGYGGALLDGIFLPHAAVARARKRWTQAKTKAVAVGRIDFPRPPEARPEFYANSVSAVQRKLFRQLDVNDDGDIEKSELRNAFVRYSALRQALGEGPNFK